MNPDSVETLRPCPRCEGCTSCKGTGRTLCRLCRKTAAHMVNCPKCEACTVCAGVGLVSQAVRAAWLEAQRPTPPSAA